ncbi:MAG: GFA family protein [Bacteroidales bacterium]
MADYAGGCHCGAVRFVAVAELAAATECNCSICTKKGAIHHRVDSLRLLSGQEALRLYQFGEMVAKHWFCGQCGIHVFTNPRAAPDKVAVNLRCLDDFHLLRQGLEVRAFDGQNWEQAMAGFKFD